jgi:hypothetical protein
MYKRIAAALALMTGTSTITGPLQADHDTTPLSIRSATMKSAVKASLLDQGNPQLKR